MMGYEFQKTILLGWQIYNPDFFSIAQSSVSDPYHFDLDPDPDPRIRIRDDGSGSDPDTDPR